MISGTTLEARGASRTAGFTLIELLVSIAIIALLITLVAVGVSHVSKIARGTSERQTVVQLNQAVQAFKQEFGFLPPLVAQSEDLSPKIRPVELLPSGAVVINSYGGTVTDTAKSFNGNPAFLEGFSSGNPRSYTANANGTMMSSDWGAESDGFGSTTPDYRFSEYSLSYFLVGALGRGLDGVDGPGMFKPKQDGTFEFGTASNSGRINKVLGRSYPPFVETSRRSPKLEADLTTTGDTDLKTRDPNNLSAQTTENVRYRLLSPSGQPYRYYRWSPRKNGPINGTTRYFNPANNAFDRAEEGTDLLNVPSLLGDPRTDAELRGAEYAIVSSGADAFFGDLNIEANTKDLLSEMAVRVKVKLDASNHTANSIAVRKAARADNIVEVGR